jgi:hypothetical protein
VHLALLVDDWLSLYRERDAVALSEMLAFILQACGLKKECVTLQDLEERDLEELMEQIHEEAKEQSDYPLVAKVKGVKSFYSNFQFFWVHLVTSSNEVLYDGVLLNFLLNWLGNLALSKMRPLRHTSTTALLAIGRSLVDLEAGERHDLETVVSFLENERRKEESTRVTHLESQFTELGNRIQTLEAALERIYAEIMLKRAKDVMLEVRSLCVQALGVWAEKAPEKYLNEKTLKCLAVMLFDKAAEVRQHTIDTLLRLFNHDELLEQIKPLAQECRLRLVEMCHDVDSKISISTLRLCGQLAKHCVLQPEHINILTALCWSEADDIRTAAFDFALSSVLNDKLPTDSSDEGNIGLDQGRRLSAEQALRSLLQFFIKYADGLNYRIELLVESLWQRTEVVKNVSTMVGVLLSSSKSNASEMEHAAVLARMLAASLKRHAQKQAGTDASTVVLCDLAELLTTYRLETPTLKRLLKLVKNLDLTCLYSKDLAFNFSCLLETLAELFLSQNDPSIIKSCGEALSWLVTETHLGQKEAKEMLLSLMDSIRKDMRSTLEAYFNDDTPSQLKTPSSQHSQLAHLAACLARFASLLAGRDFLDELREGTQEWHQSETLKDLRGLIRFYETDILTEPSVAQQALRCIYLCHLWDLNRVTTSADLEGYTNRRQAAIEGLLMCTDKPNGNTATRQQSFKLLCETLILVSGQALAHSPLYYELEDVVCATLEDYMLSVPLTSAPSLCFNPEKVFVKSGARGEVVREDADFYSQQVCLMIGRLVYCCPALTMSQLASSYLAYYGGSVLHTVSLLIKQVLNNFKTKNNQGAGAFKEPKLFFGIMTDALFKAYRGGSETDLDQAKELAKKIAVTLGSGAMKPAQAEKLRDFLLDCVKFAMEKPDNLPFFDVITIFVVRGFLSPIESKSLYDRVQADVNRLEALLNEAEKPDSLLTPAKVFLGQLGKQAGVRTEMPQTEDETTQAKEGKKPRIPGVPKRKDPDTPRSTGSKRNEPKVFIAKKSAVPQFSSDDIKTDKKEEDDPDDLPPINGNGTTAHKPKGSKAKSIIAKKSAQTVVPPEAPTQVVKPKSILKKSSGQENKKPDSGPHLRSAAAKKSGVAAGHVEPMLAYRADDSNGNLLVVEEEVKRRRKPPQRKKKVPDDLEKLFDQDEGDILVAEGDTLRVERVESNDRKRKTRDNFQDGDLEEPGGQARHAVKRLKK